MKYDHNKRLGGRKEEEGGEAIKYAVSSGYLKEYRTIWRRIRTVLSY